MVAPGLYTRTIKITQPNLILEAREVNGEVQLSVAKGPLVSINLPDDGTCTIRGFKFIHSGEKHENREEENLNDLKLRGDMNCALLVKSGIVTVEDCMVTLGSVKSAMPSFVITQGHLILNSCELKGNSEIGTIGVYC